MHSRSQGWPRWIMGGVVLIALHIALALFSSQFAYEARNITKPILWQVGLMCAAGAVYLAMVVKCRETASSHQLMMWIAAVGLLLRTILFFSTPMLEDDFYRYLWDGAVTAQGLNPYRYSPEQAQGDDATDELTQLAGESGKIVKRVNHPSLRTIYPPTAQAAFALAYWLKPWSLNAWRLVLMMFDIATAALLVALLHQCALRVACVMIYWWNPIVTTQLVNVAHMDGVILPFVVAALLFSIRQKPVWASAMLGLAVGAKVWPILLLPVILRPWLRRPARLAAGTLVFGVVAAAMFLPVAITGLDDESGFAAYSKLWEMNDALFMLILWGFQGLIKLTHIGWIGAQALTRYFTIGVLGLWILWLNREVPTQSTNIPSRAMWAVAALFLLSPTQFPWYYVWVVPLLVTRVSVPLLLLTVLLPLYYLRFYLSARGHKGLFDYGVVWIEYVPVWLWLAWDVCRDVRRPQGEDVGTSK